ncbi:MAG: DNA methyltransferase [Caldilineaceae bacterium]
MFPLEFPYSILQSNAHKDDWVADPFCGRGTTNYASRVLGLPSLGIDSSPVAVALAHAKLANTIPKRIVASARRILNELPEPKQIPTGEFWEWAYHSDVLHALCSLREALLVNCHSPTRMALRAIILGALHGPLTKTQPSYFSNQSPRTYAPKPKYAVKFWKERNLKPSYVDVLTLIEHRAIRYYGQESTNSIGMIIQGDSRRAESLAAFRDQGRIKWIVTSPPYYGMRTYLPDQWLRMWFVGGNDYVDYKNTEQLEHSSPEFFSSQLNEVWKNMSSISADDARLIIRFGAINDRKVEPLEIVRNSLINSEWKIEKTVDAGTASSGNRQAEQFKIAKQKPISEYDIWAIRD